MGNIDDEEVKRIRNFYVGCYDEGQVGMLIIYDYKTSHMNKAAHYAYPLLFTIKDVVIDENDMDFGPFATIREVGSFKHLLGDTGPNLQIADRYLGRQSWSKHYQMFIPREDVWGAYARESYG